MAERDGVARPVRDADFGIELVDDGGGYRSVGCGDFEVHAQQSLNSPLGVDCYLFRR